MVLPGAHTIRLVQQPKGRDFINTFLEGNIVVWREIVPVAVQVNGNSEGELGLSTEFSDWSRLLRHVLKHFTGIRLNIPYLSEAYL